MMLLNTVPEQKFMQLLSKRKVAASTFGWVAFWEISITAFFFLTVLLQTYKKMYNPVLYKLVS